MGTPTLNELREMATACATQYPPSHIVRAVGQALLALTDPTPLTAEHCREAGWIRKSYAGEDATEKWHPVNVDFFPVCGPLAIENPTCGQLKLALMMENSDGE